MTNKKLFFVTFLVMFFLANAQERIIDTVYIFDRHLYDAEKTQTISTINSEDFKKNTTSLSDVLRFQSFIYIKENGRGSVSSPSFRGTTAQQTAFVWNGININSIFLGQGDLANLNLLGYDYLDIKSGGGSVIYGSGAIGGTVHMNNKILFNKGLKNSLFVEYASFQTLNSSLKTSFSDEKLSIQFSATHSQSQNEYEVPKKNYINLNGKYHNTNIDFGVGYKINAKNILYWQTQIFDGLQHFPIFFDTQTRTKYTTETFRSLISWNYKSKKINNYVRTAYLEDNFNYFSDIRRSKTSGGISKTIILKNDFNYLISKDWSINAISEFQNQQAEGYQSEIKNSKRNLISFSGLLKYTNAHKIYLELGLKKDFLEEFKTPVLFSFGGSYRFADWYLLKINASKNFRYPTFNDLYWQPGGNPNLKPETSHQIELSSVLKFGAFKFQIAPYYIQIKDMIHWVPFSGSSWTPINLENVRSIGFESRADFEKKWNKHTLSANLGYSHTKSQNLDTRKQLMYVPFHKAFGGAEYRYGIAGIYLQGIFNGLTYTSSDENPETSLNPYWVMNAGIYLDRNGNRIIFKVNNITNQVYETLKFYPLPIRNYTISFAINF